MELWLYLAAGGVMLGGIVVYLMFMIFLPEWVGITGKVAKAAEESHRGNSPEGKDVLDTLQKDSREKK